MPISMPKSLSLMLIWISTGLCVMSFCWLVGDIIVHGGGGIDFQFLTRTVEDAGRSGGIAPVLVATGYLLSICLVFALPIGLFVAWFLIEQEQRRYRIVLFIERSLDILAAVPSIVFGLFGHAFFSQILGLGFSILAGGLTLSCMILPFIIRAIHIELSAGLKAHGMAMASLGFSRCGILFRVLLPLSLPGIATGCVLALARAAAETAALIFTSGYVARMPSSPLDSARALSVHIFDLSLNVPGGETNAYRSAFLLLILLLVINSVALSFARYQQQKWQVS